MSCGHIDIQRALGRATSERMEIFLIPISSFLILVDYLGITELFLIMSSFCRWLSGVVFCLHAGKGIELFMWCTGFFPMSPESPLPSQFSLDICHSGSTSYA